MLFMKPDIRGPQTWFEIDGDQGIVAVPIDLVGPVDLKECQTHIDKYETVPPEFKDYYSGQRCWSIERKDDAWGARMSAPGYMDCTEWSVFDSESGAKAYIWIEQQVCPECGVEWPDGSEADDLCQCPWLKAEFERAAGIAATMKVSVKLPEPKE